MYVAVATWGRQRRPDDEVSERSRDDEMLLQFGWALDGEPEESWAVRPFDWPRVVRHVSQARKSAQAKVEAAELGWREVIHAGLLAGQDARTLATLTGLTRQRIYQVRDGRR